MREVIRINIACSALEFLVGLGMFYLGRDAKDIELYFVGGIAVLASLISAYFAFRGLYATNNNN